MLTKEELKDALPPSLKSAASDDLLKKLDDVTESQEEAEIFRTNMVSYTSVLAEGRFKVEDYMNAVVYVSHKLMGRSNKDAYAKTFPKRYLDLKARGSSDKEISSYVSMYNKGKLVNLILEQTLIPSWVLNQDVYQQAINTQLELMTTANSEKVRAEAANSILTHLKRPEAKKVEIDLGVREHSGMEALKQHMLELAQRQQELIAQGISTREIAHQPIMKDVTPAEPE